MPLFFNYPLFVLKSSKRHHNISVKPPPEENLQFENHRKISFTDPTTRSSEAVTPVSSEVVLPNANGSDDQKIDDEHHGDASSIAASNESHQLQDETDCIVSVESSSNDVQNVESEDAHEVLVVDIKQGSVCTDNPEESKVFVTDIVDTNMGVEIEKGIEAINTADIVQCEEGVEADCIDDDDAGKSVNGTADCTEWKETGLGDTKENRKDEPEEQSINKDKDTNLADSVGELNDQTSESEEASVNAESNTELSESVSGVDECSASKRDESVIVNDEKMQDDDINKNSSRLTILFCLFN